MLLSPTHFLKHCQIIKLIPLVSCRLALCRTGLPPAGGRGDEVALCAREVAVQAVSGCRRQDQPQRPRRQAPEPAPGDNDVAERRFHPRCSLPEHNRYVYVRLRRQAVLKASIVAREGRAALAAVFLVDRFLYWTDESSRLLKITKLLHRRHPGVPVAPQLVMRNARLHFNSGARLIKIIM